MWATLFPQPDVNAVINRQVIGVLQRVAARGDPPSVADGQAQCEQWRR
jgi:hypothetical protein